MRLERLFFLLVFVVTLVCLPGRVEAQSQSESPCTPENGCVVVESPEPSGEFVAPFRIGRATLVHQGETVVLFPASDIWVGCLAVHIRDETVRWGPRAPDVPCVAPDGLELWDTPTADAVFYSLTASCSASTPRGIPDLISLKGVTYNERGVRYFVLMRQYGEGAPEPVRDVWGYIEIPPSGGVYHFDDEEAPRQGRSIRYHMEAVFPDGRIERSPEIIVSWPTCLGGEPTAVKVVGFQTQAPTASAWILPALALAGLLAIGAIRRHRN